MRAKKQVMPFYPITVTSAVYMDGTNKNFKDEYSETKSEIEQVRTATTGEKFNSVGERLNTEINRLKKGYTDVNLVEQDSIESHFIQNTCDGFISDLVIKGKISNNLVTNGRGNFVIDKNTDPDSRIQRFTLSSPLKKGNEYIGYIKSNNVETVKQYLSIHGFENTTGIYGNTIKEIKDSNIIKFSWTPNNGSLEYINNIGLYIEFENFNNGISINFSDFMLFEKGSDPININEYFDDIKTFGQEEGKINILSYGKNLLELKQEYFVSGNVGVLENNIVKINYTNPFEVLLNNNNPIRIKKGYVSFSFKIKILEGDGVGLKITEYGNTSNILFQKIYGGTITINKDIDIAVYIVRNGTQGRVEMSDIQIENGNTTLYESYKENKKEIILPQGFNEGLRGIRSAFDELNYVRDVAIKRIEKYVFNNKENIVAHEARENTIPFTLNFDGEFLRGKNNNINIICNCGIPITLKCYSEDIEGIYGYNAGLYGAISKTRLETADEAGLIKFLRSILVECYYEIETPVETPLEQHIELPSYDDATYVSFENNIVGTSSFKLPVDISKIIRSIIKENKMIENKVEKLSNEVDQIKTYMIQTLEEKNN